MAIASHRSLMVTRSFTTRGQWHGSIERCSLVAMVSCQRYMLTIRRPNISFKADGFAAA
ncbi:hypothetical protein QN346_05170 [Undibacterium sp. 5I1]|nr:hypothetical protein [Undibacterium sp. 5I1]